MIGMAWRGGSVAWISPSNVVIDGEDDRVRKLLSRPAVDTEPIDEDEVHGEQEVRLAPGTQRHARAALRTLPGAVILVDDGDG